MWFVHNGKKEDVIEPRAAAVFGAVHLVRPLRWATLAQGLRASSTSMRRVSMRYIVCCGTVLSQTWCAAAACCALLLSIAARFNQRVITWGAT